MVLSADTLKSLVNAIVLNNAQPRSKIAELHNEVESSDFQALIANKHISSFVPGTKYTIDDIAGVRPAKTDTTGLKINVGVHNIAYDPTSRSTTADNLRTAITGKITASVVKDDGTTALSFTGGTTEAVQMAVAFAILSRNAESFWAGVRNNYTLLPNAYTFAVYDKFGVATTIDNSGAWTTEPDYVEIIYSATGGGALVIDGVQINTTGFAGELIANSPQTAPKVVSPKLLSGAISSTNALTVAQLLNAHATIPGSVAAIDPNDFAAVMAAFAAFESAPITTIVSTLTGITADQIVRLPSAQSYVYGLGRNATNYGLYKDAVDHLLPNDTYTYVGVYRADKGDNLYDFSRFIGWLQDGGVNVSNDDMALYGTGTSATPSVKNSLGTWTPISTAEPVSTLYIKGQNNYNPSAYVGQVNAEGFLNWTQQQGIKPINISATDFTNWVALLSTAQKAELGAVLVNAADHRGGAGALSPIGAAANDGTQTDNEALMTLLGGFNATAMYNANGNRFVASSGLSNGVKTNLVIGNYANALNGVDIALAPSVVSAFSAEFKEDTVNSDLYGSPLSILSATNTIVVNGNNSDGNPRTVLEKAEIVLAIAQNLASVLGLGVKTHAKLVNTSMKSINSTLSAEEWAEIWNMTSDEVRSSIIDQFSTNEASLGLAASILPVGFSAVQAVMSDATKTTAQRAQAKSAVKTILTHYVGMSASSSTLSAASRAIPGPSADKFAELFATFNEHYVYTNNNDRDAHAAIMVQELGRNADILSSFDKLVVTDEDEFNKLFGRFLGDNLPTAPIFATSGTNTFPAMASQVSESFSNHALYYARAITPVLDNASLNLKTVVTNGTNLSGTNFSAGQVIAALAVAGPEQQLTPDDAKYVELLNAGVSHVQLDQMAVHKREPGQGYVVGKSVVHWLVKKI